MATAPQQPQRVYDKGERRFKHVGRGTAPYIEFDESQPKKWVGKCPNNIPDAKKAELLNKAVAKPNGDSEASYPTRLYVVHEGAIYEAQTSDGGRTYHAYPYKGDLSKSLVEALKAMAVTEGSLTAFKAWYSSYINLGGKR